MQSLKYGWGKCKKYVFLEVSSQMPKEDCFKKERVLKNISMNGPFIERDKK